MEISEEESTYMYKFIQDIIDTCGPRMPCSPQEAQAATMIQSELSEFCDETLIEPFFCSPRAFLGYIKLNIILVLCSFILFFMIPFNLFPYADIFLPILSFFLNFLAMLIIWKEFFNYEEFIDPLFKKKSSQNVIGKIKTDGDIKKVIIFSGHHDSALQFNLLRYLKIGYPIIIFLGLGIMLIWTLATGLFLILSFFPIVIYSYFFNFGLGLLIVGIIPLIALFNFVSFGERANKVPGAVDNLSAVAIVLGIGRYLKNNRTKIPKNTEIRLISFGCEEAGLRGAYRYVEKHKEELNKLKAELINMDAIQSNNVIKFVEFEPTTRTKHSEEVIKKLEQAAGRVNINAEAFGSGGSEKLLGQISGGTDATAFSKENIKAGTISATELKLFLKFYHQPTDTLDMIQKGSLEKVLKICLAYIFNEKKIS